MQISARVDYALRAMLEIAAAGPERLSRDDIAQRQDLPTRYLEPILRDLSRHRLLESQRGVMGGYVLARPSERITVADIARAVDGPLALVSQQRPEDVEHVGPAQHVGALWVGLRSAIRSVMEHVTLADLLDGDFPDDLRAMIDEPGAWSPR